MDPTILALEAATPEELGAELESLSGDMNKKYKYLALAVTDIKVLTCPFDVDKATVKDVKDHLMCEAVELLTLPADEIEFDYQTLSVTPEREKGVFICCPKNLLREYLKVIDRQAIAPVKLVPRIVAGVNAFFLHMKPEAGRFCLLDFRGEHNVSLSIFLDGQCELFREIVCESAEEIGREVIQSLRSVCSKSREKRIHHFYYAGDRAGKDGLIRDVESIYSVKAEPHETSDLEGALKAPNTFFTINLLRNYSFSLQERKQIMALMNIFLCICLLGCVSLGVKVVETRKLINSISSSYQPADYDYAKGLQKQLESL